MFYGGTVCGGFGGGTIIPSMFTGCTNYFTKYSCLGKDFVATCTHSMCKPCLDQVSSDGEIGEQLIALESLQRREESGCEERETPFPPG